MAERPEGLPNPRKSGPRVDRPWRVVLYNDDVHKFEDVVRQVRKATGFSLLRAMEITYVAHNVGEAVVYEGAFVDCVHIADELRKGGLSVRIFG
ncbi:MAG: ATP-dependent Clp protease adaptor ClpS [candidate division KSB1 bacterium]|nr:ATP-dependent Clp protease adaptor ClpS [candidate division KSB1 bacterium]